MLLTLPTPPSTNNLFVNVKGRGRVKTDRYRSWLRAAGNELRAQKPRKVAGPVAVSIEVGPDKRRDLDNYSKAVLDLLVMCGAIDDDSNVMDLRLGKRDRDNGTVLVMVGKFDVETA